MKLFKVTKLTLSIALVGATNLASAMYSNEDPAEVKAEITTASPWHLNNLLLNDPDDSDPEMYARIKYIIKRHDEGNTPGLDAGRIKIWRKALKAMRDERV